MSLSKVDPTTGALTKISGLVDDTDLKQDIADIQAVIPSGASSSNQLVATNQTVRIHYYDADTLTYSATDPTNRKTALETVLNEIGQISYQRRDTYTIRFNGGFYCEYFIQGGGVGDITILETCTSGSNKQMWLWKAVYTNNAWTVTYLYKLLADSDLTSSVTSGSTAPLQAGALATVSDTTISGKSSAIDQFGITYKKSGVVVNIECSYMKITSSISAWSTLATLTNLLKPTGCDSYFQLVDYNTGAGAGMLFIAKDSNQLKCGTAIPVGVYYFSGCYVA